MTIETAQKIVKGITDKIECNTADIDDWAEFWGFTREEYEEFLDMAVKALDERPKGKWITDGYFYYSGVPLDYYKCTCCNDLFKQRFKFCPNCGAEMEGENDTGESR